MTNLEKIKNMSLDELAEWLDENAMFDNSPWIRLFTKNYCDNCESIKCKYVDAEETLGLSSYWGYTGEIECAYCELEDEAGKKRCRFFPEFDDVPDNKTVIKLWLEEGSDD